MRLFNVRSLFCAFALFISFSAVSDEFDAARNTVEVHFASSAEPSVIDATWTDRWVFKVGMTDNGSSRDGFAQYVCMVLGDHGFSGKRVLVRVVDYYHLMQTDEWINLGTAQCQ